MTRPLCATCRHYEWYVARDFEHGPVRFVDLCYFGQAQAGFRRTCPNYEEAGCDADSCGAALPSPGMSPSGE